MPARGKRGFASDRQRAAAEANLRKGNPKAYSKAGEEPATPAAGDTSPPDRADASKPKTIRAKSTGSQRRSPAKATPAPAVAPATPSPSSQGKKHFLDDVLGGLFG